jgi:hypothetical protein
MKAPTNVPGYPQLCHEGLTYDVERVNEAPPSNRSVECTFLVRYGGDGCRVQSEGVCDPV